MFAPGTCEAPELGLPRASYPPWLKLELSSPEEYMSNVTWSDPLFDWEVYCKQTYKYQSKENILNKKIHINLHFLIRDTYHAGWWIRVILILLIILAVSWINVSTIVVIASLLLLLPRHFSWTSIKVFEFNNILLILLQVANNDRVILSCCIFFWHVS